MRIAVTGGTGFVGGNLLRLAVAEGHQVKALTRRPQQDRRGVDWITGSLDRRDSLRDLVENVDALIHVAGVVNAPDAAGFDAGNATGTLHLLAAATAAGIQRFVHVSSLAAREPDLSLYGASKAKAERLVMTCGLDWAIVRPPAVYGPGDGEMLDMFKAASRGVMPLPPRGRLSAIFVEDLARLLLALAGPGAPRQVIYEADDGHAGGYSHVEFARAIAASVQRRPLCLPLPASALRIGARLDRWWRGDAAKLTPDRAAYFCHPDWVADPAKAPPSELWRPAVAIAEGMNRTAGWHKAQGWL